ncbi:LytR/AlgR family response regulator transcription factor [Pelomonas sp. Root1237]|uniref:LytR/AlgR family response regulator transcription factor n=1 Tax=Pelomonas sp. Root1237 TaxID=1736434 RepID=UPI0006F70686|nr:response regulator [Pelomonas sp. Root1237]KQV94551.1 two-component system response regulator [Pelomonas sp. Root1237]
MAALRILVVDDEAIARRNLVILLSADPDVAAVVECDSGQAAVAEMRRTRPDVLFLDVHMPECDGFDVLELMGSDMPAAVVFVTAYDEYALRAFDAGALDYLLKPFDDARFHRALQRAKFRITQEPTADRPPLTQLVVKNRGKTLFLNTADVDWIEAADYYAYLHVGNATHILRRSLHALERELDAKTFVRIHRSIIVNRERVRGLELHSSGEHEVVLQSGVRLSMSRRFRKNFTDRI